jgi:hypothetical protein
MIKSGKKPGVNKKYEINYFYEIKNIFLRNKKICFYEIKNLGKNLGLGKKYEIISFFIHYSNFTYI